jgi:hypothetical protein
MLTSLGPIEHLPDVLAYLRTPSYDPLEHSCDVVVCIIGGLTKSVCIGYDVISEPDIHDARQLKFFRDIAAVEGSIGHPPLPVKPGK